MPSLKLYNHIDNTRHSPKKRKREDSPEVETKEVSCEPAAAAQVQDATMGNQTSITCRRCPQMRRKVRSVQKLLHKYKKKISELKLKAKNGSRPVLINKEEDASQQFIDMQIKLKSRKPQGRRYSDSDKKFALALYYCSTKSYKFLRQHFCLPAIRSLRNWLLNVQVKSGLNEMVLSMMAIKAEKLKKEEKVVSIIFDEMFLKQFVSYD